jgi:predicted transcriptional regulator
MPESRPATSQAEREVLKILWEQGPGTVREISGRLVQAGQRWAYSTVITLLGRLEKKGYVASDKSGFAHVFHAALSREEVVRQRLTDVADELCEGERAPLLLALVDAERFTTEELEAFRKLIERSAPRRKTRKSSKRSK